MEKHHSYSIGDLSRRSGLSVRTIRFYSDVGVVPASARSASGYRLYDVEAVARLDLVRTLRDLGLPLESIRALLNAQTSLPEVAAAHLEVLDHQIQALRLRRAVLRAAAKTNTTPEEVALMHQLVTMSEVERQHLIDDFLDDTFGDTNANPELVAMLRAMRPACQRCSVCTKSSCSQESSPRSMSGFSPKRSHRRSPFRGGKPIF